MLRVQSRDWAVGPGIQVGSGAAPRGHSWMTVGRDYTPLFTPWSAAQHCLHFWGPKFQADINTLGNDQAEATRMVRADTWGSCAYSARMMDMSRGSHSSLPQPVGSIQETEPGSSVLLGGSVRNKGLPWTRRHSSWIEGKASAETEACQAGQAPSLEALNNLQDKASSILGWLCICPSFEQEVGLESSWGPFQAAWS